MSTLTGQSAAPKSTTANGAIAEAFKQAQDRAASLSAFSRHARPLVARTQSAHLKVQVIDDAERPTETVKKSAKDLDLHDKVRPYADRLPYDAVALLNSIAKAQDAAPAELVEFGPSAVAAHLGITREAGSIAQRQLVDLGLIRHSDNGSGRSGYRLSLR